VAQEPEGSSPHSQQPATSSYPEPVKSNQHPPKSISLRSILIPSSHTSKMKIIKIYNSVADTRFSFVWYSMEWPITQCIMLPAHMVRSCGLVLQCKRMMTIVTALSNSCILKAHCRPSTSHRRMAFVGLKWKAIESNLTTNNRDRTSVHPPWNTQKSRAEMFHEDKEIIVDGHWIRD
jgi:hypothetical protein